MSWDGTKVDNTPTDTVNGILNASDWNDLVAYVKSLNVYKASLASPIFTGTPAAPTATADTNTTQIATTAFVLVN